MRRSRFPAQALAAVLLVPAAPALAQADGSGGTSSRGAGVVIPPREVLDHHVDRTYLMAKEDFRFLDRQLDYLPPIVAVHGRRVVYTAEGLVDVAYRVSQGFIDARDGRLVRKPRRGTQRRAR